MKCIAPLFEDSDGFQCLDFPDELLQELELQNGDALMFEKLLTGESEYKLVVLRGEMNEQPE